MESPLLKVVAVFEQHAVRQIVTIGSWWFEQRLGANVTIGSWWCSSTGSAPIVIGSWVRETRWAPIVTIGCYRVLAISR